jgi:hypothetical protein
MKKRQVKVPVTEKEKILDDNDTEEVIHVYGEMVEVLSINFLFSLCRSKISSSSWDSITSTLIHLKSLRKQKKKGQN